MTHRLGDPASRASEGRAPVKFNCLAAMNEPENTTSALSLQVAFIARRIGTTDPATLAAIATLAFSTREPRS